MWLAKLKEVVDRARPDILWQDFSLNSPGYCFNSGPCAVGEQQRLEFLAYYYNQARRWGKDVVATYKHFDKGFTNKGQVEDYERGGPASTAYPYWLTDDAISSSWSYTEGIGYYSSTQMIHALIDRVSKNGNMLLNISPTLEGTIPDEQRAVLADIGTYLRRVGASIYATRAWDTHGEGPTKMGGGSFVAPKVGTAKDIRFTRDKAARVLHATVLAWPGETLNITTLSSKRIDLAGLTRVELLGAEGPLTHVQDATGLRVTLPAKPYESPAYVVKLTFASRIPALGPETGATVFPDRNYRGTSTALAVGTYTAAQLPQRISSLWPADGYEARGYPGDDLTGTPTTFAAPNPDLRTRIVSLRVTFDPASNGFVVDGAGATQPGAYPVQTVYSGAASQQWSLRDTGGNIFVIANRATGLVLDSGGNVASGSPLKQWTEDGSPNLRWQFSVV